MMFYPAAHYSSDKNHQEIYLIFFQTGFCYSPGSTQPSLLRREICISWKQQCPITSGSLFHCTTYSQQQWAWSTSSSRLQGNCSYAKRSNSRKKRITKKVQDIFLHSWLFTNNCLTISLYSWSSFMLLLLILHHQLTGAFTELYRQHTCPASKTAV